MKRAFVSAVAVLFCISCILLAVAFGYSRYKTAKAREAALGAALQNYSPRTSETAGSVTAVLTGQGTSQGFGAHMPEQIGRKIESIQIKDAPKLKEENGESIDQVPTKEAGPTPSLMRHF